MIHDNRCSRLFRSASIAFLLTLSVLFLPALTWCQATRQGKKPEQQPAGSSQPRVNVGVSTAKPGDIIDIPITLSAPDTVKVNTVVQTLSFPKKVLSLTKTELGLAGEQSQAEIKTDTKDDSADENLSGLVVTISSKGLLKPGILAYLKFKVSPDAAKSTVVLKVLDSKLTAEGSGSVEVAKGKDGEVTIFNLNEEIPIVGCFFFSH